MEVIKKINYCWFGYNPLPDSAKKCIESWKKYCPDFEIIQWNEGNFDIDSCDYVKEAYKRKRWAFVSDYARFWILYNYGGLYFDTDVELISPIDDIISRGAFMGLEREFDFRKITNETRFKELKTEVAPGLGLYANPGLGLYAEILDNYNKRHFIDEKGNDDITTVVKIVSDILSDKQIEKVDDISMRIADVYLYRKDVFCPMDYKTGKIDFTNNTRSIHHYSASWMTEEELMMHKIFIKSKNIFGERVGRVIGGTLALPKMIKINLKRNK